MLTERVRVKEVVLVNDSVLEVERVRVTDLVYEGEVDRVFS